MGKVDENKRKKRLALLTAAYELFTTKGEKKYITALFTDIKTGKIREDVFLHILLVHNK